MIVDANRAMIKRRSIFPGQFDMLLSPPDPMESKETVIAGPLHEQKSSPGHVYRLSWSHIVPYGDRAVTQ